MKCSKCGNEIQTGLKFCTGCGAKLENETPQQSAPTENCAMTFSQENQILKSWFNLGSVWCFDTYLYRLKDHTEKRAKIVLSCNWLSSWWNDYTIAVADVPIIHTGKAFQLDLENAKYSWKISFKGWCAIAVGILAIASIFVPIFIILDFLVGHASLIELLKERLGEANLNFVAMSTGTLSATNEIKK